MKSILAQIRAKSQFSPDFGHTNASATRGHLSGKPMSPRTAPPGNGGPEKSGDFKKLSHQPITISSILPIEGKVIV